MFGFSVDLPAARRAFCQWRLNARPPSMHASDDPIADVPIVSCGFSACHRSARMWTHRSSIAAVCGYSSLSIMFLSNDSMYRTLAAGSIHVVTKVARFWRALPSRNSSS